MAQADGVVANGTGSAVRSDINNQYAALWSNHSGSTEPSSGKVAYQTWADTNSGYLKIRNAANNAWVSLFKLDGTDICRLTASGDIELADSKEIKIGTGADLILTSDGTNGVFKTANGAAYLQSDTGINLTKLGNTETLAKFISDGACELYNDNSLCLKTTQYGIETDSTFQGTGGEGVVKVKTGGGASNQTFVSCYYNASTLSGGIRRDGTSQAVELFNGSDRRIKKDIAPMPAVLSKLNQIELKTYKYKDDETASGTGPIAQDLISIFPDKVVKTDDGTGTNLPSDVEPWSVGTNFTWQLIKAVQELSAEVETLKTKVAALEAK
tara:strand:- start:1418 stop:2395 length:978 start_codon:yes stop_codon:yes gene_type:complete